MFDIDVVMDELKKNNPAGFINEAHLQVEFGKAIFEFYKKQCTNLVFEYPANKKRIDLFAIVDNEQLGFEFKFFTKASQVSLFTGMNVNYKDHISRDLLRIKFWKDVEKIETAITKNIIQSGYCVLLSNDSKVFNKTNNLDKDFDISNGLRPSKGRLIYKNKKGKICHDVKIKKRINCNHVSYNSLDSNFEQLIVKVA